MSGTSYGTVVLHCSPESVAGGPLAFVATATSSDSTFRNAVSISWSTRSSSKSVEQTLLRRPRLHAVGGAYTQKPCCKRTKGLIFPL